MTQTKPACTASVHCHAPKSSSIGKVLYAGALHAGIVLQLYEGKKAKKYAMAGVRSNEKPNYY